MLGSSGLAVEMVDEVSSPAMPFSGEPIDRRHLSRMTLGERSLEREVLALFDRLRNLRKKLADQRRVPAYIIFGDATLRAMARYYPATPEAMEGIPGLGEKKRAEFGATFATEISNYLSAHAKQAFN